MAWNWETTCPACAVVSGHLGPHTPCPYHAGQRYTPPSAGENAATSASPRPTAERPWPFTTREYARLLILRSRYQERSG